MKRIIISGGGTGGHIYPAITIARAIQKQMPVEILYVGSKDGLEAEIIPKEGFEFETLELQSFARKITVENVKTIFKSAKALLKARGIIKRFKPDVVIGTGGYVCGPMLMTAALMGIPTIIQEQNVIAGVTNKILGRVVNTVAVGYKEAISNFPKCKNVVYTGNPIREDVLKVKREEARAKFNLENNQFTVLVSGGSRGARSINNAMIEVHKYFAEDQDIKIIHVTGSYGYNDIAEKLGVKAKADGTTFGQSSTILPYMHNMPDGLAASDLAIFRAGAIGIAELTARGIPSILVPYPYAAEDHQTYNAKALVANGAAKMIVDKELTGQILIEEISRLKNDRTALNEMAEESLALGKPNAAKDIAELAIVLAR